MKVFIAYILVVVLVQFCLTIGTLVFGFFSSACLAWMPDKVRVPIASTLAGVAGVVAAVAFGNATFRIILGPGSFGIAALLASTLPLAVPILNDRKRALQLSAAEQELPKVTKPFAAPTTDAARFTVSGYLLGLVLVSVWFCLNRANAD